MSTNWKCNYLCSGSTNTLAYVLCGAMLCLVSPSCLTLCNPMGCNLPGCSVHGILQARILEWVAMPFSRGSSQSRNRTQVFWIAGGFYQLSYQGSRILAWESESRSVVSDSLWPHRLYSVQFSIVPGILQARILAWVSFLFSRESLNPGIEPRSPTLQADSLPTELWGKPPCYTCLFSSKTQSWEVSSLYISLVLRYQHHGI